MFHLDREIHEQPAVIERLLSEQNANIHAIAQSIRNFNPSFVVIAARGTSDNAARYAQYAFGIQAGLSVALATPSVHTLYGVAPRLERALVIGISQSGSSLDVRKVIEDAREQNALTVSITNTPDSPLAQTSHHHIPLNCGEEISVAATKTYTAELAAIAMLVSALTDQPLPLELPQYVQETLSYADEIAGWVERYRYTERLATIGRGYNYCTALEIGLKVKELCYITGEEYSEADFRHGPIAIIQRGFPVFAVAPQGKTLALMQELIEILRGKSAECLVISNDADTLAMGHKHIPIATHVPEWLAPICAVIPGQMFAFQLALAKGNSVDKPEGLQKVTITV